MHRRTARSPRLLMLTCAVALSAWQPRAASAGPSHGTIVIDTYRGLRTPDAERAMSYLRDELARLGWVSRVREVKERLGNRLALPGIAEAKRPPSLAAIQRKLDVAVSKWVNGTLFAHDLVTELIVAISEALESPALLVAEPGRRDKLQRAMLYLALVYDVLARDPAHAARSQEYAQASRDWMAEMIRTFPQEVITQNPHGPVAVQLYKLVRDNLGRHRRGTLLVTCTDPDVQLYVNEVIRQPGKPIPDLVPGVYRVLVIDGDNISRHYEAGVLPDQNTILPIDWELGAALDVRRFSVSLVVPAGAPEGREVELARRFAYAAGGAPSVAVIGFVRHGHEVAATASLYSVAAGKRLRWASVVLGSGDEERIRALARFLVKATPHPALVDAHALDPVLAVADAADAADADADAHGAREALRGPPDTGSSRSHPYRRWLAASAAVVALAGSAALFYVDDRGFCSPPPGTECPRLAETSAGAYASLAAGVALTGLAAYLFLTDRTPTAARLHAWPLPGGAIATVGLPF